MQGDFALASPATPVLIDSDMAGGCFLPDNLTILYVTSTGALRRATASNNPAPITLLQSNARSLATVSTSRGVVPALDDAGRYAIVTNKIGNPGRDLALVSTSVPGNPVVLAGAQDGELAWTPFTGDGTRALYYLGLKRVRTGRVGALTTVAVGGGQPSTIASNSWTAHSGTGTVVAYNADYKEGVEDGFADLYLTDLKGKTTAVAVRANAEFRLDAKRTSLVYVVAGRPDHGIWVTNAAP